MKIKDIPLESRPREKFAKYGPDNLSNAELLAIILQNGTKNKNAIALANDLLGVFESRQILQASIDELQKSNGIGFAKAVQIKAVFEFSKRIQMADYSRKLKKIKDVYDYYRVKFEGSDREILATVCLDKRGSILSERTIGIGNMTEILCDPKLVFRDAIKNSAYGIIVVHNHPSGDSKPSINDIEMERRLKKAGEILGLNLIDFLIFGHQDYYSFKEKRIM